MANVPAVIVTPNAVALQTNLERHAQAARGAYAKNTERAFKSDSAVFSDWCSKNGRSPLPASVDTIVAFIDDMATDKDAPRKAATIRRYLSSIAKLHRAAGAENPVLDPSDGKTREDVLLALKRIAKAKGTRQKQAQPLNRPALERLLAAAGETPRGLRDAALLAVAYDTLCRRSELVALKVSDFSFNEDGSGTALIRKSKTDQTGKGMTRFLAVDTVVRIKAWLAAANVVEGEIFLSVNKAGRPGAPLWAEDVQRIFAKLGKAAGLSIAYSGHSTRVGAAQDLVAAGFGLAEVMQAGGWRTGEMVARYTEHQQARRGAMAKLAALQNRL